MILLVIPKKQTENSDIANAIGIGLILGAVILFVPKIIDSKTKQIKQQGIEEYIKGDVQIVYTSDSTCCFIWYK